MGKAEQIDGLPQVFVATWTGTTCHEVVKMTYKWRCWCRPILVNSQQQHFWAWGFVVLDLTTFHDSHRFTSANTHSSCRTPTRTPWILIAFTSKHSTVATYQYANTAVTYCTLAHMFQCPNQHPLTIVTFLHNNNTHILYSKRPCFLLYYPVGGTSIVTTTSNSLTPTPIPTPITLQLCHQTTGRCSIRLLGNFWIKMSTNITFGT